LPATKKGCRLQIKELLCSLAPIAIGVGTFLSRKKYGENKKTILKPGHFVRAFLYPEAKEFLLRGFFLNHGGAER